MTARHLMLIWALSIAVSVWETWSLPSPGFLPYYEQNGVKYVYLTLAKPGEVDFNHAEDVRDHYRPPMNLREDAQTLCTDYGGLLAEIRDEDEMNMLRTRILQNYDQNVWIGIEAANTASFVFSSDSSSATYFDWQNGVPTVGPGDEICAVMRRGHWQWHGDDCADRQPRALCKVPVQDSAIFTGVDGNELTYVLIEHSATVTYDDAEAVCQTISSFSHLAYIETQAEGNLINTGVPDGGATQVWIGLTDRDNDQFKWDNGNGISSYSNWASTEPSPTAGDQCVHADATNGWVWSAGDCSTLMLDRFLCETAIGDVCYNLIDLTSDDRVNISSPGYNDGTLYPLSTVCTYNIRASPGDEILLLVEDIDVQGDIGCGEDYLQIPTPSNSSFRLCDGTVDRVELLIDDGAGQFHFVTDSARSGRGWLIEAYVGQDCNAGFGDNGRGECVACGEGSYSGAGEASCTFCGPNTNTGGNDEATSSSECACNAGHGDRNDGNGPTNGLGCTVCGVGSYAAQGNNTCTSCGPNTDTGRNPTAISVAECGCKPGYAGTTTCAQCPVNTYSPGHMTQCTPCGQDLLETEGPGATSAADCIQLTRVSGSLAIDATYNDNLNDTSSPEYEELRQEVEKEILATITNITGTWRVENITFSQGSIIVNYVIVVTEAIKQTVGEQVVNALLESASDGSLMIFNNTVLPNSINFEADFICQTGYFPVHSTDEQGMQSIDCQSGAPLPHLIAGLLTLMMITGQMILGLLMTN